MDPYAEPDRDDVAAGLCAGIRAALQPLLPDGLRAQVSGDEVPVFGGGDVDSVTVERSPHGGPQEVVLIRFAGVFRRGWIQVTDTRDEDRILTVINVLRPGDKAAGQRNREYRRTVRWRLASGISQVELDLLRTSRRRLTVPTDMIPPSRRAAYYACVCRAHDRNVWAAYPMPLRQPLPTIPVPCRRGEADVPLPLQPVFDRVYHDGRFETTQYHRPLDVPLDAADATWAADLVSRRHA